VNSKHGVGKPMENLADVILVPSRFVGKVGSIDSRGHRSHIVSTIHTTIYIHTCDL